MDQRLPVVRVSFVAVGVMMCSLYPMQLIEDVGLVDIVDHQEVLKKWLISGVCPMVCRKCSVLICLSLDFLRF